MSLLTALNQYNPDRISVRNPSSYAIESVLATVQEAMQGADAQKMMVPRDILAEGMKYLNGDVPLPTRLLKQMCFGGLSHVIGAIDNHSLIARLLQQVETTAKSGVYHALLKGYLFIAKANDPLSDLIRRFLEKKLPHFNVRVTKRITEYELLGIMPGKKLAGMLMQDYSRATQAILAAARFNSRGEGAGYLKATFVECCNLLAKDCTPIKLQRFFSYVGKDVIFSQEIGLYTKALLGPWEKSGNDPDETTKLAIQNFLIEQFGDPRIKKAVWNDAGSSKSVLLRWLVAQSLDLMLQVLSASNDTGQWKERAGFWRDYIKLDVVTDAWVVFGRDAYRSATEMVKEGDLSQGGFGRLHGNGAQPMHSVLLMRIGDMVISEWTHSGKMRMFTQGAANTPAFYQQLYHPHRIRADVNAQEALVHHINWQPKFARLIHHYTGISNPAYHTHNGGVLTTAVRDRTRYCSQCNGALPKHYLHNICLSCNNTTGRTR